jgi:hypothetical protein
MFYILTCGSTASVWLARALCRHPEIVCFHGKRTIAANPTINPAECPARQFVGELAQLHSVTEGEKVFGAIHGHGHREIVPEIAAVEGAFAAMMRHPITRINSFFHQQAPAIETIEIPSNDIYRLFREDEAYSAEIDDPTIQSPLTAYARLFSALCSSVLDEDSFILGNMHEQDIFQYEKIVVDPRYFRACFETLAEGCRHAITLLPLPMPLKDGRADLRLECTQEYLDRVFNMGIINPKKSGAGSAEEIFALWPHLFKSIFVRHLEKEGGKDALDRYAEYGYRLPHELQDLLVRKLRGPVSQSSPVDSLIGGTPALVSDLKVEGDKRPLTSAPARTPSHDHHALAETKNAAKRLKPVLAIIEQERSAYLDQIKGLQDILKAERGAAVTRIRALETELEAERRAQAIQVADMQAMFAAEREAAVARIREFEGTLKAKQATFIARIRELEGTLKAKQATFIARIRKARHGS